MGKKVRWIVIILLLLVFLGSGTAILVVQNGYKQERAVYEKASKEYRVSQSAEAEQSAENFQSGEEASSPSPVPVKVDFEALRKTAPDVVGWIYCEGTDLDFPVVQGTDNSFYLSHSYDGKEIRSGAVFVDAKNAPGFADSNTIIYGHHMVDGSMFACLKSWMDKSFYDEHKELWLLTPDKDYKVTLVSGYTTSATSDTYTIFQGPSPDFEEYLKACCALSVSDPVEIPDPDGRYIVLSTCAYDFEGARYVLHGKLEPVE